MDLQHLIVALVVPACALHALWRLIGAPARRRVTGLLARLPLPRPLALRMQAARARPNGCGCDGCDAPMKSTPTPGGVPVTIVRRPRG